MTDPTSMRIAPDALRIVAHLEARFGRLIKEDATAIAKKAGRITVTAYDIHDAVVAFDINDLDVEWTGR